jgi:hypothetical protein
MFKSQYQTSRIREDLQRAAFGPKAAGDNARFFTELRNISLTKDSNAPINVADHEWLEFEARGDTTQLRTAMAAARRNSDLQLLGRLTSRLKYRRRSWSKLKLAEKRRNYFELADRLRAQSQQPPRGEEKVNNHLAEDHSRKSNAPMADQVWQHIRRKWNTSNDDEDQGRYVQLLVAYLKGSSKANLDV